MAGKSKRRKPAAKRKAAAMAEENEKLRSGVPVLEETSPSLHQPKRLKFSDSPLTPAENKEPETLVINDHDRVDEIDKAEVSNGDKTTLDSDTSINKELSECPLNDLSVSNPSKLPDTTSISSKSPDVLLITEENQSHVITNGESVSTTTVPENAEEFATPEQDKKSDEAVEDNVILESELKFDSLDLHGSLTPQRQLPSFKVPHNLDLELEQAKAVASPDPGTIVPMTRAKSKARRISQNLEAETNLNVTNETSQSVAIVVEQVQAPSRKSLRLQEKPRRCYEWWDFERLSTKSTRNSNAVSIESSGSAFVAASVAASPESATEEESQDDEDDDDYDDEDETEQKVDIQSGQRGGRSRNTPSRKKLMQRRTSSTSVHERTFSPCLTPKARKLIAKSGTDNSPRHTPKLSSYAGPETPGSEQWFAVATRLKFRTPLSPAAVKVGKEKKVKERKTSVKRPRKGNRQGIDSKTKVESKLPVLPSDFSLTKEMAKVPSDVECTFPWHERNMDKIGRLTEEIKKDFPRWFTYLSSGFNIMLHGYGSKQTIFEAFHEFLENKYLIISINGLFKNFNARKFLGNVVDSIDNEIEIRYQGSNINLIVEDIAQKLSAEPSNDPIFIFVSNFDVLAMRHHSMLTCLCGLAKVPYIHIVASSDHINSGLGINPLQNLQLNFAWFDCTTLLPYQNELIWNPKTFGELSDRSIAKNSLEYILKSITPNAKKAFARLAYLQIQKMKRQRKNREFEGVEFRELFRVCREAFIAHTELVLRSLLTEFVDHKLIHFSGKSNKHEDNNFLRIDLDEETLQEYAEM